MLAGPGAGLRALIAPAGYGKTTTLATAVDAARRAGRPVLAVSTTNQAVGQLRQVGIPATTVARFALDHDELPPGLCGDRGRVLPAVHPRRRGGAGRGRGLPGRASVDGGRPPPSPAGRRRRSGRYGCPNKSDTVGWRPPS